jgi:hypothetical protein
MIKLPCVFEDGCLFYTVANFYREQSNLKGIFFELKCSCCRFENWNRYTLVFAHSFIPITYDDSRRHRV